MLKVRGTELRQAIHEALFEIAGPHALPFDADMLFLETLADMPAPPELGTLAANLLDSRKLSTYGGSNEIQRNVIAQALLKA